MTAVVKIWVHSDNYLKQKCKGYSQVLSVLIDLNCILTWDLAPHPLS